MDRVNYYVLCSEVLEGLRDSEATVVVAAYGGRREFVRASRSGLHDNGEGKRYLCVGLVGKHPDTKTALIQFPEEADSGANRIWVPEAHLLMSLNEKVPA